ncbi:phosphatidylinositol-glycan biosynthesis class F protein-like [Asterias rubens]|uniref:phosphatidylinositol-glycan biosynthesis class F protein-like n=1 Tax=Asterias rubens TaxID=7604 RepID=UPI00145510D9|nr:phosphatidylinositol-glycan biosynthesis class F protein-like [Asterias rubens]
MAASIDGSMRSGGSSFSLKFTILGQVIVLLFTLMANAILVILDSRFNLIQNALYSMRTFSIVYGIFQCVLYGIVFREKFDSDLVGYRTSNRVTVIGKISRVIKCALLFSLSCIIIHIVLILFGAAVQEAVEETSNLAILLSTLSTLPCLCLLGGNGEAWNRFVIQRRPFVGLETCVQYVAFCSLVGAWMGAFTIPLDWDRDWQDWPIPCAIGALLGHTIGLLAGCLHLLSLMSKQNLKSKNKNF